MSELCIFYAPDISTPVYTLSEEESQHAVRVMRLREGERIQLNDGKGHSYIAEIAIAHPKHCEVSVVSTNDLPLDHRYNLHIAIAPPKSIERFEWFVEKAVEIGVDSITPLLGDHSERKNINFDRTMRIIVSAMKQSQKAYSTILYPLITVDKFLSEPHDGVLAIAHCENNQRLTLPQVYQKNKPITILIGPEGDFSPSEIKKALDLGYKPITLGDMRLRTETAAVVACHSIYMLSEML